MQTIGLNIVLGKNIKIHKDTDRRMFMECSGTLHFLKRLLQCHKIFFKNNNNNNNKKKEIIKKSCVE